jgi:uncharacterized membrane protein YbhN (UPF0104 family)
MAFHESFWVVAGTASPVILLAQIVAAGEALVARSFARGTVPGKARLQKRRQIKLAYVSYGLSSANVLLQGVILLGSLGSLAQQKNIVSVSVVGIAETTGLIMLLYSSLILVILKTSQAHESKPAEDQD